MGRDNNNYDIRKAAKLYRLIKIRMKLVACSIFSKLSFDNILWLNRKIVWIKWIFNRCLMNVILNVIIHRGIITYIARI